jgi:WS/DGAT/MGAT family acyltransferase
MLGHERLAPNVSTDCPWLLVYRGPCPSEDELRRHVAARLGALPKLRMRLAFAPLGLSRPLWVPDPDFDLSRHVGLLSDPRYHGPEGWLHFISEDLATPLDKGRPLWRLVVAPGDGDGTFAVILSHHHSLADGQSAMLVLRTLLVDDPPGTGAGDDAFARAIALPSPRALAWRDAVGLWRTAAAVYRRIVAVPGRWPAPVREARESLSAVWEIARMLAVEPSPARVPELNSPLGPRRRVAAVTLPLDEVRAIAEAAGCFPNDVYLAVAAGGLRQWLAGRGVAVDLQQPLRAGLVVNVGGRRDRVQLGNGISGLAVELPIEEPDPLVTLRRIQQSSARISGSRLVQGLMVLTRVQKALPPVVIAQFARLTISPRTTINVVTSSIVAPRRLGRFAGRKLEALYSWTFLPARHAVSFMCHTWGDQVTIGVLVEPDLVPDVDALCDGMRLAHRELFEATAAPALPGAA